MVELAIGQDPQQVRHPATAPDTAAVLAEYTPALARLATRYAPRDDREDLLQDILLALWRALPTFRGEASMRTFVYRVAHNRGIAWWRARRREVVALSEADDVPDPRADIEQELEARLHSEQLGEAMNRLPHAQRETVRLSLRGLSYQEIAMAHGVSVSNVGVRLTRARQSLRRQLRSAE